MNTSLGPSRARIYAALITVQFLFGINYVVSKWIVQAFPPLLWASIRIIVAAVLMFLFTRMLKRPHPPKTRAFFGPLVIFSILGIVVNQSAFLVGLHYTTATNSSILNTLIPIFTLLIVTLRGQEPVTRWRVLGFVSALIGVLVLRNVENFTLSDQTAIGDSLTILNCLSYGFFLSFGKKFLAQYDRFWVTTWLFLYGSIGITTLAAPDWIAFQVPQMTPLLWGAAAFAIIGGTLLTYFLNNFALAHTHTSQVALFIYIQPVVASFVAWMFLGEAITFRTVIAGLFIFLGLLMAVVLDRRQLEMERAPI